MFMFMTDDTQASRNANAPGGPGGLRTWRRLLGMALSAALIGAAGAAAWKAARTTTAHQWYAVGMLALSETLIGAGLNPRRPKEIRHADGSAETVTLEAIAGHPPLLALRERMIDDLLDAALIGLAVGAGIATAVLAALHYAGGRLKRGRRLRGGDLVSARQLRRRVSPLRLRLRRRFGHGSDRPRRIAGIPLEFPGAWPVARIRLRYGQRPKAAERFAPREDGRAERPDETNEVIEQAPEAEAAVDLWESDPLLPGNGNPASASRPSPSPPAVESGANAERSEAADEPQDISQPEPSFAEDTDAGGGTVGETARTEADPDIGPDEDGRPPGASASRADMRGRNNPDGARPEGGMIPI